MIQVYRCVGKLSLVRKAHNVIMSLWCSAFLIFLADLSNFVRFVNEKNQCDFTTISLQVFFGTCVVGVNHSFEPVAEYFVSI